MSNKIEEHLITPHLIVTQIFQLQGYGQYGLCRGIVIVPTNLYIIQVVLPWMPYEDQSIFLLCI